MVYGLEHVDDIEQEYHIETRAPFLGDEVGFSVRDAVGEIRSCDELAPDSRCTRQVDDLGPELGVFLAEAHGVRAVTTANVEQTKGSAVQLHLAHDLR